MTKNELFIKKYKICVLVMICGWRLVNC